MSKNKVVVFNSEGIARILITDDVTQISEGPGEKVFINPELGLVLTCPPEFWKLENGQIIPMSDPAEIALRNEKLNAINHIKKSDFDLRDNISVLRSMPEVIQKAHNGAAAEVLSRLADESQQTRDAVENARHSMGYDFVTITQLCDDILAVQGKDKIELFELLKQDFELIAEREHDLSVQMDAGLKDLTSLVDAHFKEIYFSINNVKSELFKMQIEQKKELLIWQKKAFMMLYTLLALSLWTACYVILSG